MRRGGGGDGEEWGAVSGAGRMLFGYLFYAMYLFYAIHQFYPHYLFLYAP